MNELFARYAEVKQINELLQLSRNNLVLSEFVLLFYAVFVITSHQKPVSLSLHSEQPPVCYPIALPKEMNERHCAFCAFYKTFVKLPP